MRNNHIPFRLRMTLLTPFCLTAPLTLDALLSAAVFKKTGLQGEDTIPHIPLTQEKGVFKASALFCSPLYQHVRFSRIMALNGKADLSVSLFAPHGKNGYYPIINKSGGPYGNALDFYQGIRAPEVYFWGVGDLEAVCELLDNHIIGIGKRADGGAGQIDMMEWAGETDDYSWMTEKGAPARPLPVELWNEIGGSGDYPVASMAVTLPYYHSPKIEAVFPAGLVA